MSTPPSTEWTPDTSKENSTEWTRASSGMEAVITQTREEVQGVVRAAEKTAHAKRKGGFVLRGLQTVEEAAEVVDKLITELSRAAPSKDAG